MAVLRMNPREFARYHERLAREFKPTLLRGLRAGAARALPYLVDRTRAAPPANPAGIGAGGAVNTGNLIGGWRVKPLPDGAAIINLRSYGPTVDGGRRAGSKLPPLKDITRWIMRRLGKSESEARKLAFPFARAIARRGLIARKILTGEDAQIRISELVHEEMQHELDAELEKRP